jgi:hypothetical protein
MREEGGRCSAIRITLEYFSDSELKDVTFWVVMPCGSCKKRRFEGTNRIFMVENLRGKKMREWITFAVCQQAPLWKPQTLNNKLLNYNEIFMKWNEIWQVDFILK